MLETCTCGATHLGDRFSASNFRDSHKECREAWVRAQSQTSSTTKTEDDQ